MEMTEAWPLWLVSNLEVLQALAKGQPGAAIAR